MRYAIVLIVIAAEMIAAKQDHRPACPRGRYEIETCITGGAVPRDPNQRASRGCVTRCAEAPPRGSPGMRCMQLSPYRFHCLGLAPSRPPGR